MHEGPDVLRVDTPLGGRLRVPAGRHETLSPATLFQLPFPPNEGFLTESGHTAHLSNLTAG